MGLASKVKSNGACSVNAPPAPTLPDGPRFDVPQTQTREAVKPPLMNFDAPAALNTYPATTQRVFSQTNNVQAAVRDRLNRIVHENKLQAFYPQTKLDAVLRKASSINYEDLARKWKLPPNWHTIYPL